MSSAVCDGSMSSIRATAPVTIGAELDDGRVEVLSGLSAGEKVVRSAQ